SLSNRTWAKLSGLPAQEIGRCERAFGDALDWGWQNQTSNGPGFDDRSTSINITIALSLSR
ncbi:hypothetical protein C8J56DRAFT_809552, partial [Mycena floridula]